MTLKERIEISHQMLDTIEGLLKTGSVFGLCEAIITMTKLSGLLVSIKDQTDTNGDLTQLARRVTCVASRLIDKDIADSLYQQLEQTNQERGES